MIIAYVTFTPQTAEILISCPYCSSLGANVVPEMIGGLLVVSAKYLPNKRRVFEEIPVAKLVELAARGDESSAVKCAPRPIGITAVFL